VQLRGRSWASWLPGRTEQTRLLGRAGGRRGRRPRPVRRAAARPRARIRCGLPRHPRRQVNLAYWTGCAGDAVAARDQFGALLLSYELVFSPEPAETLAVWYQLACWTAQAANDAAKQDIVTRPIRPQGVADADDEGDVVEEGEGDSEGLGEFDGLAGVAAGLRGDVPALVRGA
jgi:hypothetical protein